MTVIIKTLDEPGILSRVLSILAESGANILTIHQAVPVNGVAAVTLSMDIPKDMEASVLTERIEEIAGISYVKILAEEPVQ